ncbi:MAG: discoidin domain-containing protein, partial [Oscillospiraceae bacterium]|nr:discoidin domain-containing protein [Oscillospiraceae bacterium]
MKKYQNMGRALAILLVLAMLLPFVSMPAFSTDIPCAEDGCSGKYRNGICSAAGHFEAAPIEGGIYRISNAGQLYWFAALVNAGGNEYNGDNGEVCDAVLTNDITVNADMDADDKLAWIPIGLYTSGREYVRYSGTFDGAGYTVYGLYYDNVNFDGRNAGLFGTVDGNGTVKNLTLADSCISGSTEIGGIASHNYGTVIGCTQSGTVTGIGATGGIVCRNMGTVENCVNTGAVTGATAGGIAAENSGVAASCANSGAVSGTNSVGGIVGLNSGDVTDCLNAADVAASEAHVGGVVGNHQGGEIRGCGNSGTVTGASDYIGGVAGGCYGAVIAQSFNTGAVTGAAKSEAVGGVVGGIDGSNLDKSTITSCYNTGTVTGRGWVGGIAGVSGFQKTPGTVELSNSYNTGAVSGTSHAGAVVGKLSKGSVAGIYFLKGSAQNSVSGATEATAEQFASGEIAAELNSVNQVWYQALDLEGIEPDASPVLDPDHGVVRPGYCNCTEWGYTNRENPDEPGSHVDADGDNVCDICGHVEGEAHEHVFGDEWTVTKEPTCSEPGMEERACTECGWKQKREIPKTAHTEETIPGVPATFDETGTTDGVKCSVCGEILVPQETAPVLDYNDGIIPLSVLTVSCGDYETDGGANEGPANLAMDDNLNTIWHTDWYGTSRDNHWIQFELSEGYEVDGLRYKPRITGNTNGIITRYDIQVSDDGVSFTSVATGSWEGNRNWKVVEFDAQNVKYVRLVALDALTDNAYVFACAAEIRLTGVKAGEQPHEHEWSDWTVTTEPTCTEKGVETRSCACGETETREIPALGHEYVNGKCTRCGDTLTSKFEDVKAGV